MPLDDQDIGGASIAGYGLLASLTLTVLKRIDLTHQGKPVQGVSEEDIGHLKLFRELLVGSARGAELSGRHVNREHLMSCETGLSLDAKFQAYELIDKIVGPEHYEDFVNRAQDVVGKLADDPLVEMEAGDREFVEQDLEGFLVKLQHGSDWVEPSQESARMHRALA